MKGKIKNEMQLQIGADNALSRIVTAIINHSHAIVIYRENFGCDNEYVVQKKKERMENIRNSFFKIRNEGPVKCIVIYFCH